MQQKISSLGSIMESERSKVASLESFRSNLQSDLSQAKSLELEHRKMALAASEELESERRKWKREVEDWEGRIRGKERECRDLMGENEGLRGELRVEREKVLSLKVCFLCYCFCKSFLTKDHTVYASNPINNRANTPNTTSITPSTTPSAPISNRILAFRRIYDTPSTRY
jgi:hypothetical protein